MEDKDPDVPYAQSEAYQVHRHIFACVGAVAMSIYLFVTGETVGGVVVGAGGAFLGVCLYAYHQNTKKG